MVAIGTAMYAVHLLFAGLWAGGVAFVAWAILPAAKNGTLNARPLEAIAGKLTTLSRVSALVLLLTGGHLAMTVYGTTALLGSRRGHLVLSMVVLWFALTGLVEVGTSRLTEGTQRDKVRSPASDSQRFFQAAAVIGILLLVVGGVLTVR
ncbi:MAG: CopD family protein [Halobacteriales archaeon]